MNINHLLSGMILQVNITKQVDDHLSCFCEICLITPLEVFFLSPIRPICPISRGSLNCMPLNLTNISSGFQANLPRETTKI